MIRLAAITALAALSGGCAVLPDTVAPEFEHMSHATQHQPFTAHPSNVGAEILQVTATWNLPHHFYVEASEGIDLDKHYPGSRDAIPTCGEIEGPREQFTARIGYTFQVRK